LVPPNKFETYLIITARKNVYQQYLDEFKSQNRTVVKESVFCNLWNTVFPRFKNRPWCDIPGTIKESKSIQHCMMSDCTCSCDFVYDCSQSLNIICHSSIGTCDTCYEIDTQRRSTVDAETQEQLKIAHHMRRGGLFNLEMLRYKSRCAEAISFNSLRHPTVMSLIIDGMDQNHCKFHILAVKVDSHHLLLSTLRVSRNTVLDLHCIETLTTYVKVQIAPYIVF